MIEQQEKSKYNLQRADSDTSSLFFEEDSESKQPLAFSDSQN